ncbi:hypothetical protein Avbf_04072 [Armadillidium vulgare]|nr:hypothetical protein Avbf_04072 [Armadillidium vulgare]
MKTIQILRKVSCTVPEIIFYKILYTFSLLLVFLLEAIGGIMAYVYEEQVMTDLTDSLSTTFNGKYGEDEAVSEAVDAIQTKVEVSRVKYKPRGSRISFEGHYQFVALFLMSGREFRKQTNNTFQIML